MNVINVDGRMGVNLPVSFEGVQETSKVEVFLKWVKLAKNIIYLT